MTGAGHLTETRPEIRAETRAERAERLYAEAERPLIALNARRTRRGPELLIGVLVGLALAVGVVAAVDLRRLNSPGGTALAWTGAATFGDCTAYEKLSIPAAPATGVRDPRSPTQQCLDLQRRTAPNRAASSGLGIDLLSVEVTGDAAVAQLRLTRGSVVFVVPLQLERRGAGWVVRLSPATCLAVGCR